MIPLGLIEILTYGSLVDADYKVIGANHSCLLDFTNTCLLVSDGACWSAMHFETYWGRASRLRASKQVGTMLADYML